MKITIDSCLINSKEKLTEMNKLEDLAKKGIIEIVGTERLIQETENHSLRKAKAESYKNISEPYTVGKSRIGSFYISDGEGFKFKELALILFPNKNPLELNENESNDVMHLVSHTHSDSEYFVTNNTKDFIDVRKTNKNRHGSYLNQKRDEFNKLGIKVVTPKEMLNIVDSEMKEK